LNAYYSNTKKSSFHLEKEEGMPLSVTGIEEMDCQGFKCAGSRWVCTADSKKATQ